LISIPSLKLLRDEVNKTVIGQKELVNNVTLCLYRHLYQIMGLETKSLNRPCNNLLISGKTGTGKTFSVKETAKLINIPFVEINCKSIAQEGWEGTSLIKLIERDFNNIGIFNKLTQYAIIFLDEFDKLCSPLASSKSENYSYHLQASILKYIEGVNVAIGKRVYDTGSFCFIFAGSFVGLNDSKINKNKIGFISHKTIVEKEIITNVLSDWGVMPELAGRITKFVKTNDFTREMYRELILNENLIVNQWYRFLSSLQFKNSYNINYSKIITEAIEKDLGVRGLIQTMQSNIDEIIEENSDSILVSEFCKNYF
jgi:ATP-dependent Clp protease ATP-binding subunit ClpX